jgi:hypothetical protein
MRTTQQLAGGDLGTQALLGTLATTAARGGGSFGSERADFGNWQATFGYEQGFGYVPQFGDEHPAPPAPPMPPPAAAMQPYIPHAPAHGRGHAPNPHDPRSHGELMRAWHYMHGRREHTLQRTALLNPNEHSDVKIEAYVFSLNPTQFSEGGNLSWGTLNGWTAFRNPQVAFRAERVFVNVNLPGLVYVNVIQAANVNAQIGGTADGFSFSPLAQGSKISLPTLPPQNTMQVVGTWTNIVPAPYNAEAEFVLAIDFEGWATVTA